MSEPNLDSLYKRASAEDEAQPGKAVREAILQHAQRVAEQATNQSAVSTERAQPPREGNSAPSLLSRWMTRWPRLHWHIAVPLSAAALAAILLQSELRSGFPLRAMRPASAPLTARVAHPVQLPPSSASVHSAPEPFPAANAPAERQASTAAAAPAAPLAASNATTKPAGNADLAASSESIAPMARLQMQRAAAPPVPLDERAAADGAAAPAASQPEEPLLQAASRGELRRVRSLLQTSSASVNARDAAGRTALMLAVLNDYEDVTRALLDRGANPNIADTAGRTPLAIARQHNQPPIVAALLQAGAR